MAPMQTNVSTSPQTQLLDLREAHQQIEDRLYRLDRQRSLSPEEEYEMKTLKKRKLALKDQITSLENSP